MHKQELWTILDELCSKEGVALFDIEVPQLRTTGILRVYISRSKGDGGIQHEHCAGVSHSILNHPQVEEILPGNVTLEVSSPGINRKLSRSEHFSDAVGERVRVSFRTEEGKKTTITGDLKKFDGEVLHVLTDEGKKSTDCSIPISSVQEARVDFLFK